MLLLLQEAEQVCLHKACLTIKMGEGWEVWTDERGADVNIYPCLSSLYEDLETNRLNGEYSIGKLPHGAFGLGQRGLETLVERIFGICRVAGGIVGVDIQELERFGQINTSPYGTSSAYIADLLRNGYLREKWVKGRRVVFPTEKLLESQKAGKIDQDEGPTGD